MSRLKNVLPSDYALQEAPVNVDLVRGRWYLVTVPPTAFAASKGLNTGVLVMSIVC